MSMTSPMPKQIDGASAAAIKKSRRKPVKFDQNGKPQQQKPRPLIVQAGLVDPPSKKKPKAKPAAKPASKKTKAKTAKPKAKAKETMVAEILRLASRPSGVSREELNEATGWKGAPWKWLFSNPKKNGFCDRHGYRLKIIEAEDGVRYRVTKR